ncbi:MAG TPA: 50S ribosomal protein L30 [Solirubrobacterales bacterium]|nr:50S ribosomal protein L30 [Solirubrobacterales bacterium]
MASKLVIRQRRSAAGANRPQRETLRSLGLRGIGTTTERSDNPALRGMLRRVAHLVEIEETANA